MMEKYEIQKLRDLPIEKVAKQMGMKVEHHKALCPFHDDTTPASRSTRPRTAADVMSA
jgi:DNA primase